MELIIERTHLKDALAAVCDVTARSRAVPILTHILFEPAGNHVTLSATDMESTIHKEQSVISASGTPITLDGLRLGKLMPNLRGERVVISSWNESGLVELKAGPSKFLMEGLDPRDHPARNRAVTDVLGSIRIAANVLVEMIAKTSFAIDPNEGRQPLAGVHFFSQADGQLTMVASDGHRLAEVVRSATVSGPSMIVSRRGIEKMGRMLLERAPNQTEVELQITKECVGFTLGEIEFSTRLLEGEFPNYQKIMPNPKYTAIIKRGALALATRFAATAAYGEHHQVGLSFMPGKLTLSAGGGTDQTEKELDILYDGEIVKLYLNANNLTQALEVMPEGDVAFGIIDENSAMLITSPDDPGYKYTIMPIR